MAFRTGDRVQQQTYGVGEISEVSGRYISVTFDDDGVTRKFVASIVSLEPTAVPRPAAVRTTSRSRRKQPVPSEE